MEWYSEFNGAFWISMATLIVGTLGIGIRACISSKCSETNLCFGCLRIVRDTHAEEDIEIATINHTPPIPDSKV